MNTLNRTDLSPRNSWLPWFFSSARSQANAAELAAIWTRRWRCALRSPPILTTTSISIWARRMAGSMSRIMVAESGNGWPGSESATIWCWITSCWILRRQSRILVGAWVLGSHRWRTLCQQRWRCDLDQSSPQMKGQSIRALVNCTLRSEDIRCRNAEGCLSECRQWSNQWKLISPEGSQELHEVESIAIDPKDPKIIYAGTWHLPWKTTDDGANWSNIKAGRDRRL